jgi:hypothetical protein
MHCRRLGLREIHWLVRHRTGWKIILKMATIWEYRRFFFNPLWFMIELITICSPLWMVSIVRLRMIVHRLDDMTDVVSPWLCLDSIWAGLVQCLDPWEPPVCWEPPDHLQISGSCASPWGCEPHCWPSVGCNWGYCFASRCSMRHDVMWQAT